MKRLASAVLSLAAFVATNQLQAATAAADFNDLALGPLMANQKNSQPADSGTGFKSPHWLSGSGVPRIVAGDLTPPASTRYSLKQPGTPRSFQATSYNLEGPTDRRQGRPLAEKLTGTVWFSFIVKNADATQAAGIDFNVAPQNFSIPTASRVVIEGSTLRVFNSGSVQSVEVPDTVPLGKAALIVGCLDVAGSPTNPGNDALRLWVNPVLGGEPASLGKPTVNLGNTSFVGSAKGIISLGLQSYNTGTGSKQVGGVLDAVRLADGDAGYAAATGAAAQ
ncbi:MAG TPA: hypothetical protein VGD81_16450 [Opitutaceae bacterium]